MESSRRRVIGALGGLGLAVLAGCIGNDDPAAGVPREDDGPTPADEATPSGDPPTPRDPPEPPDIEGAPPVSDTPLYLAYDTDTLLDNAMSGGVPQDGIPSIDEPRFAAADDGDIDGGDPVFGVVVDGEARAYPQEILVWHEVVNDTIAGENLAVTYCPLTGTAQGFERGPAEFGVSGQLVNSNLIMYDRSTNSWWPQVISSGIDGPMVGQHLREFRVIWTTWGRWRAVHPDTTILTEDTGYIRRYGNDPYGSYNPDGGYYVGSATMFPPLQTDDREHPKEVVIGTRTDIGAICFNKETLLADRVMEGRLYGDAFVAVADVALETGYVYRNPDERAVDVEGDDYRVDGATYTPDELPLDRSLAFDAMWFAWFGFYPDTAYVR